MSKSLLEIIPVLADATISSSEMQRKLALFIELLDWNEFCKYINKNLDHFQHFLALVHDLLLTIGQEIISIPKLSNQDKILDFLIKISQISPEMQNFLAANIQFESILHRIFNNIDYTEYSQVDATQLLPFVKFIYAIVSSPSLLVTQQESCKYLFDHVKFIFNFSNLSAWGCAIIAQCLNYHAFSIGVMKTRTDYSEFFFRIEKYTNSQDIYLQLSSIAAYVKLSQNRQLASIFVHFAIGMLQNESLYLPTTSLASKVILELCESYEIDDNNLKLILSSVLKNDGFNSYNIIELLTEMKTYHSRIAFIVEKSEYITELLNKMKDTQYDFIAVGIRHFLQLLSLNEPEFYSDINKSHIFADSLQMLINNFQTLSEMKIESLVFIIMTYVMSNGLSVNEKLLLNENSNQIFVLFMKLIEDSQLISSIYFCNLIIQCIRENLNWESRFDQIAVQTQLLPLISTSLTRSSNKSTLETTLYVFNYFYTKNSHFIDVFSSSLAHSNREFNNLQKESRIDQQSLINSLQIKQNFLVEENEQLKKKIAELAETSNQTEMENNRVKGNESKLSNQIKNLYNEIAELNKEGEYNSRKISLLTSENDQLRSSLLANTTLIERLNNENDDLKKEIQNSKDIYLNSKSINYYSTQNKVLSQNVFSLESKLQQSMQDLNEYSRKSSGYLQEIKELKDELEQIKVENIQLKTQIFELQNEIEDKDSENHGLSMDAQLNEIRLQRVEANENMKSKLLDDALLQNRKFKAGYYLMAREKRKWEHISKFGYYCEKNAKETSEQVADMIEKTTIRTLEIN